MTSVDKGHLYLVQGYDGSVDQPIRFMKRLGPRYPGNLGPAYGGTNCQELLRVLIDRVIYLERQEHAEENYRIINHLRNALRWFEDRAARIHSSTTPGLGAELIKKVGKVNIELLPPCRTCGHVVCGCPL